MMMNLFSVFDPSSSIFSFSWIIILMSSLFVMTKLWKISNPYSKMISTIIGNFKKEVSFTLNKTETSVKNLIMVAFLIIISMNVLALYPQIFSPTSHLTVTLPLSLLFWLTIVMFGWMQNTNHMMAHLLPQGTPGALMMFMVMIEMVSNIIRPITLCVRLTANLIAGHLLMSLLGNALSQSSVMAAIPMMLAPLTLTILEFAVACIQAYVFMTLITLYTTEVK